jgi:hypothetical protein
MGDDKTKHVSELLPISGPIKRVFAVLGLLLSPLKKRK